MFHPTKLAAPALRSGLRATAPRARAATPLSPRIGGGGVRGIRTEPAETKGEGMGGAHTEQKSQKVAIAAATVLIGGAIFMMLGKPEQVATVADKVDPGASKEIQRKMQ